MRKVHYESDFEFRQSLGRNAIADGLLFKLEYYIQGKEARLEASNIGGVYVNCYPDGDDVIVAVDRSVVQFGIGALRCRAEYYLDNEHFERGFMNYVSDSEVGIELHRGATDDMGELVASLLPAYTKGDKMTYVDLTEEEKEDLASHVDTSHLETYVDQAIQQAITNTLNSEV